MLYIVGLNGYAHVRDARGISCISVSAPGELRVVAWGDTGASEFSG